jgi:C4-dicarboxylate transporter DctM subunit
LFTPTESAGIACVVALIIGIFIYKEVRWKDLPGILVNSAKQATIIMFIIACATAFSYFFSYSGLTKGITNFVLSCHMSPTLFLLFCFVLLVLFGMFMDGTSIAVLLVPLLWPVAEALGINVIHFGIVFCILNSLGCCTPPVAVNLFGMSNISGLSVEEITKGEMPFFIANLCVVLMIIFVPFVTLRIVG